MTIAVYWDVKHQNKQTNKFHILDPEYDNDLRNSSILGFGTYSKFSVVDRSSL